MKWKTITLLMFALLIFSACAAPAPASSAEEIEETAAQNEQTVKQVDMIADEAATQPIVTVYKSPTCGCCSGWVEHMEESGFVVEAIDTDDLATVKAETGVPSQLQSCHTAIVDGYVIEGHVPAEDITQLLTERPDVIGLAVPGMPVGSPGMEVDSHDGQPFDVVAFDESGNLEVFASHNE